MPETSYIEAITQGLMKGVARSPLPVVEGCLVSRNCTGNGQPATGN